MYGCMEGKEPITKNGDALVDKKETRKPEWSVMLTYAIAISGCSMIECACPYVGHDHCLNHHVHCLYLHAHCLYHLLLIRLEFTQNYSG